MLEWFGTPKDRRLKPGTDEFDQKMITIEAIMATDVPVTACIASIEGGSTPREQANIIWQDINRMRTAGQISADKFRQREVDIEHLVDFLDWVCFYRASRPSTFVR